jgi:hypothetical protein
MSFDADDIPGPQRQGSFANLNRLKIDYSVGGDADS